MDKEKHISLGNLERYDEGAERRWKKLFLLRGGLLLDGKPLAAGSDGTIRLKTASAEDIASVIDGTYVEGADEEEAGSGGEEPLNLEDMVAASDEDIDALLKE